MYKSKKRTDNMFLSLSSIEAFNLLMVLGEHHESKITRKITISKALNTTNSYFHQVINKLEQHGLVEPIFSNENKMKLGYHITHKGMKIMEFVKKIEVYDKQSTVHRDIITQ